MGNEVSQLEEDQLERLKKSTHFTEKEISKILRRYSQYDSSEKGVDGIPFDVVAGFPEYIGQPLVQQILKLFIDKKTGRIHPERFLYFLSTLSAKATVEVKRKVLFRSLDVNADGCLDYQSMYRYYQCLFGGALTDHQLLRLTAQCLHELDLEQQATITNEEFNRMIPDGEILERMTIELQLPS